MASNYYDTSKQNKVLIGIVFLVATFLINPILSLIGFGFQLPESVRFILFFFGLRFAFGKSIGIFLIIVGILGVLAGFFSGLSGIGAILGIFMGAGAAILILLGLVFLVIPI